MSAILNKKIILNSDGGSQRPLIDVDDMCKTILWFIKNRFSINNSNFCINIGSNKNNFKIISLANLVSKKLNNIEIQVNNKNIDTRSYNVDFSKILYLRPKLKLNKSVNKSIKEVYKDLSKVRKTKVASLIRLKQLEKVLKNDY